MTRLGARRSRAATMSRRLARADAGPGRAAPTTPTPNRCRAPTPTPTAEPSTDAIRRTSDADERRRSPAARRSSRSRHRRTPTSICPRTSSRCRRAPSASAGWATARRRSELARARRRHQVKPRKRTDRDPAAALAGPDRRRCWRSLLAAALAWFLIELFQPFGTSPHGHVKVVIPPNSSSSDVGKLLHADGVISSSFFFELRATLAGDRSDLRSGTYHLQEGMSYSSVLKKLTTAPPPIPTTKLTITDGHSRAQVAALLRAQRIKGNYVALTRHSKLLNPHPLRRAEEHARPRGLPVPRHVQAAQAGQADDAGQRPADGLQAPVRAS